MLRREFLVNTTGALGAMSLPGGLSNYFNTTKMGIVVHSYAMRWKSKITSSQYPSFNDAIDLLDHAAAINAGGIQVMVNDWPADYSKKFRDKREKSGLYFEGSITLPKSVNDLALFESQVIQAKEAGASVLRTVTFGPRRYETFKSFKSWTDFKKQALFNLQLAEPILKKHTIKLAVENHKDFRSDEMLTLFKSIESEYIGSNFDFGNNIALLEDPIVVLDRLAPYVVSTHIKDMAVTEYDKGFLLSEVPLGTGILDLKKMIDICKKNNPNVNFNLEMITRDPLEVPVYTKDYWATFMDTPATDLSNIMMWAKDNKKQLPKISSLSDQDKLKVEEENILACLAYSREKLNMN